MSKRILNVFIRSGALAVRAYVLFDRHEPGRHVYIVDQQGNSSAGSSGRAIVEDYNDIG